MRSYIGWPRGITQQRRLVHAAAFLALTVSPSSAEVIRLRDETTVSGEVVRVDDEHVLIRLPREAVATVDGTSLPSALVEGMPAPAFRAQDVRGKFHSIGDEPGTVTVLHFWVHWCPHCRADAAKVQKLYERFADDPVVRIVTVNLDRDRAAVEQFIQEHHATYPVIFAEEQAAAPNGADLPGLYQIQAFPVTYLIDQQQIIRRKLIGSFVEGGVDLDASITKLLPAS
ncbi:MAG: TlpA disulfide reductase family protein [Candidatus Omnitrophota bacterium]|nr:TlpA disulfide reductase family protein [Candidatus Omnitrophota bacterium]